MEKQIAVFGTLDILRANQEEPNSPQVATCDGIAIFTTGRLEKALAEGFEVWVVSTRDLLLPHDEWWQKLVPAERVLLAEGGAHGALSPELLAPWRTLYETFGIPWGDFKCWLDARDALSKRGIKMGYEFRGQ